MKQINPGTAAYVFGAFAPVTMIAAAVLNYIGTACAVGLFEVGSVTGVGWGRFATAALVMLLIFRPRIELRKIWIPVLFGIAMTSMNMVFYHAIAYIPLGAAVSLEFLGPIVLSAITGRSWRVRMGLLFALTGVALISWVGVDVSNPKIQLGVLFAFASGLLWAIYIFIGGKIAVAGNGVNSLAIGMTAGALFYLPFGVQGFVPIAVNPKYLALMFFVGIFSSFVPFLVEIMVMRYISTPVYSLLVALYPATSLLVGLVVLRQIPTLGEIFGLLLVTIAVGIVNGAKEKSAG